MRLAAVIQEEHLDNEAGALLARIASYEKEYEIRTCSIYQLDLSDSTDGLQFMSLDWLEKKGVPGRQGQLPDGLCNGTFAR